MSLIINRKLRSLMKGYPTVSDKYDVAPAVLGGESAVVPGTPLTYSSTTGHYEALEAWTSDTQFAGVALATNVQLPTTYPAETPVSIPVGTGFNLCFRGAIAVEIPADTDLSTIKEGTPVYITADGLFSTEGVLAINAVFSGLTEVTEYTVESGTKTPATVLAEIYIK